jgi:hypothetical protein
MDRHQEFTQIWKAIYTPTSAPTGIEAAIEEKYPEPKSVLELAHLA